MSRADLRGFVGAYEHAYPGEVVHVAEPVGLEHDIMAVVLEYERRRRYPILVFEKVRDHDIPVVANVVASRRALAFALGVDEGQLAHEYASCIKERNKADIVPDPQLRFRVSPGYAGKLRGLHIEPTFPGDTDRYL